MCIYFSAFASVSYLQAVDAIYRGSDYISNPQIGTLAWLMSDLALKHFSNQKIEKLNLEGEAFFNSFWHVFPSLWTILRSAANCAIFCVKVPCRISVSIPWIIQCKIRYKKHHWQFWNKFGNPFVSWMRRKLHF